MNDNSTKSSNLCNIIVTSEECPICFTRIENPVVLQGCSHKFCSTCIVDYLNNKINASDVDQIKCPLDCSNVLEREYIKSFITTSQFEKYLKFVKANKIKNIRGAVFCPFPDCESYWVKHDTTNTNENPNDHTILSVRESLNKKTTKDYQLCQNGHRICHKCNLPYHSGSSCENKLVIDFNKWKKDNGNVKSCPMCNYYIEKNKGCNHIKCGNSACKYEFCWVCKGLYTSNHYGSLRSFCYGNSDLSEDSCIVRHPWLRFLKWISIILLKVLKNVTIGIMISLVFILSALFPVGFILLKSFIEVYCKASVISNKYFRIFNCIPTCLKRFLLRVFFLFFFVFLFIGLLPLNFLVLGAGLAISPIIGIICLGVFIYNKQDNLDRAIQSHLPS